MTPDEVAVRFHSKCMPVGGAPYWCSTHESRWAFKVQQYCDDMTDWTDLAEQAVESYQKDLRVQVAALLKTAEKMEWDRDAWLAMAYREVLEIIDGVSND